VTGKSIRTSLPRIAYFSYEISIHTKTRENKTIISTYLFKESFGSHRFSTFLSRGIITSLFQQARKILGLVSTGPRTLIHMVPRQCRPVRRAGGRSHTRRAIDPITGRPVAGFACTPLPRLLRLRFSA
jgi:hypothetical protein